MRVASLGTGVMGAGMASSLRRRGIEVQAWNRPRTRAGALTDRGVQVYDTAAEAVADADVAVTMLFDADSVLEVMTTALPAMRADAVWVQSSTIGLVGTAQVAALAASERVSFVDAPVLGTKGPAEQGQLVWLAAGDPALAPRIAPALDAMGTKTLWVADSPGPGSALKLVCNAWVTTLTAGVGQSVALAGRLDLDPQLFLDAIGGGPLDVPYAHVKAAAMMNDDFSAQFPVDGVRKDLALIRDAQTGTRTATELTNAVLDRFDVASKRGHGKEDMAAVVWAFRPE